MTARGRKTASGKALRGVRRSSTIGESQGAETGKPLPRKGPYRRKGYDEVRHHTGCVVTVKFPDLLQLIRGGRNPPLPLFLYFRLKNNSVNRPACYEARSVNRFPVAFFIQLDLLDDVGRRATVFKLSTSTSPPLAQTSLLPAISLVYSRRLSPADLARSRRSSVRCVLFKRHHPVDRFQCAQHIIRCSSGLTGRESPFSRLVEHRCSQRQSNGHPVYGHLPDRDVPGVQDVKDTVGHHHFFTRLRAAATASFSSSSVITPKPYLHVHVLRFPARSAKPWMSQFADHHTSRRIGKEAGFFQRLPAASVAARTPITVSPAPVTHTLPAPGLTYAAALYPVAAGHTLFGTGH